MDSVGCISSTNYPSNYPDNDACTIFVDPANTQAIEFVDFNTEAGWDVLQVNSFLISGEAGGPIDLDVVPVQNIEWASEPWLHSPALATYRPYMSVVISVLCDLLSLDEQGLHRNAERLEDLPYAPAGHLAANQQLWHMAGCPRPLAHVVGFFCKPGRKLPTPVRCNIKQTGFASACFCRLLLDFSRATFGHTDMRSRPSWRARASASQSAQGCSYNSTVVFSDWEPTCSCSIGPGRTGGACGTRPASRRMPGRLSR